MSPLKNVLIIAAHPDDEVLGVGGTIAKMASHGCRVSVVFIATGIAARYKNPRKHKKEIRREVSALRRNAKNAARILRIKSLIFLDFPDNRLDSIPSMDLAHALKKVINDVKPAVVYTHHFGDYNWDHRIVFDITLMACRPNPGDFYPEELYSYEVLSSTERSLQAAPFIFTPNVYENIGKTLNDKKKAMMCYTGEIHNYPHPRSLKAIEYLAGKRGAEAGLEYAEAFHLIRRIQSP